MIAPKSLVNLLAKINAGITAKDAIIAPVQNATSLMPWDPKYWLAISCKNDVIYTIPNS